MRKYPAVLTKCLQGHMGNLAVDSTFSEKQIKKTLLKGTNDVLVHCLELGFLVTRCFTK